MKNFFIGFHNTNQSPCVVNKHLLANLPRDRYMTHYNVHGIKRRWDCFVKILTADKIIISGIFLSRSEVKLIRLLGKKFVYLMHGSYFMETGHHHPTESLLLEYADRIISVSRVHADMIRSEFPQYTDKVVEWFNGIDWDEIDGIRLATDSNERKGDKIVLFGGGRHMKGNLAVCQAVEQLNHEKNLNIRVEVYGETRDDDFSHEIAAIECVDFKPLLPRDKINYELAKADLFVANSSFDTFNLAVIDAIGVGCSVLFSRHVGAKDIIPGKTDNDIIADVNDIEEIKSKIEKVLIDPNNERLYHSIDKDGTSWASRARSLTGIVDSI